jgi:UDP-glucose 4-epimerase
MHILITGGAGFIGSNLAEFHLAQGHKVHAVDDLSTGRLENIATYRDNPDFRFDHDDILTWDGLEKAVTWADRIYHMAAVVGVFRVLEDPVRVLAINSASTERLLRMAHAGRWSPQILIASSSEVYGHGLPDRRKGAKENTEDGGNEDPRQYPFEGFREDLEPMVGSSAVSRWNYPISKLTSEALGLSFARKFGSFVVVARIFNTIGPRQMGRYGMVVPRFVEQAVAGQPITVFGDGRQMRSFCDVRDTVAALDLLLKNPESSGQIVNVGNNREISILELAEMVRTLANSSSVINFISHEEAYREKFEETYRRKPDLEKFFRLTGYRHQWTLEDTIKDLVSREKSSGG